MCEELIFCIMNFMMIDLDKKLTPYQWVMAILSIISIF